MEDVYPHSFSFSSSMTTRNNPSHSYSTFIHLDPLDSEIAIALEFFAKKVLHLLLNLNSSLSTTTLYSSSSSSSSSNPLTKNQGLNKKKLDAALKPFLVFDCIKSTYLSLEPSLFLSSDISRTLPYTLSQLIQITLFAGAVFLSPKEVRSVNYQLCANALIGKEFIVETWVSRAQLNQVILELKTQAYLAGGDLQDIFKEDQHEVGELLWRLLETRKKELIKTPLSRLGLKYKRSSFVNLIDSFLRTLVLGELNSPSILETWLHSNFSTSSSSSSSAAASYSPPPPPLHSPHVHPSSSSSSSLSYTSSPSPLSSPSPTHSLSYPDPPPLTSSSNTSPPPSSSSTFTLASTSLPHPSHPPSSSNSTWMSPSYSRFQPSSSSSSSSSASSNPLPPPPSSSSSSSLPSLPSQYTPPSLPVPPSSYSYPPPSTSTSLPNPATASFSAASYTTPTNSSISDAPSTFTNTTTTFGSSTSQPPISREDPNDVWQDPSFLLSDLFSDEELVQEATSYFKVPEPSSHPSSSSSSSSSFSSSLNSFSSSFCSRFAQDEDGYEDDPTSARVWRSPHPSSPSIPPNLPSAPPSFSSSSLPSYSSHQPPPLPSSSISYFHDTSTSTHPPLFTPLDSSFHATFPPPPSSLSQLEAIYPTSLSSSTTLTHSPEETSPSTALSIPPLPPLPSSSTSSTSSSSSSSVPLKHRRWTKEEEQALELGMHEFGSSYSKILYYYGKGGVRSQVLQYRDQVQLKDKARNIRANREKRNQWLGPFVHAIMPMESRGSKKKKKSKVG